MKTFATTIGLLAAAALQGQALNISTEAGYAGKGTNDGAGSAALFNSPQGAAIDAAGNVYVADTGNNTIRVITRAGISSTLAGIPGVAGSADGTGPGATFNQPTGITLDSATNLYVTDFGSSTIRQVTLAGHVTTIAGAAGVTGSANNTGTNATFSHPMGIAVDASGNLYVADYGNHLIRKITSAHAVSTLAGQAGVAGTNNGNGTAAQFNEPEGVAVSASGTVYVADTGNAAIRAITSGGSVSTLAGSPGSLGSADGTGTNAQFYQPTGIAITGTTLYVSDTFKDTLRQVSTNGIVLTVAGAAGIPGNVDAAGSLARFSSPQGVGANGAGTVCVADTGNGTIRLMSGSMVSTLAGSPSGASADGMSTSSRLRSPQLLTADSANNIYAADAQNSVIRKISASGAVTTLAGSAGVFGYAEGLGPAASFSGPQGVAVDASGNVYVSDTGNDVIRKLTPAGQSSLFAGSPGRVGNADGTGTNAHFNTPTGMAWYSGTLYVADTLNHTIRAITSGGVVSTLVGLAGTFGSYDGAGSLARFNNPTGVAVDGSGNIYVTDFNNDTIREVSSGGVVTTIAGWAGIWGSADGTGTNARFSGPAGISVDPSGNLYVADTGNGTIRKLTPSGPNWISTTVAGNAGAIGSTDGSGAAALFYYPSGVAVNGAGYVFVADSGNNTIRTTKTVAGLTWANPASIVYGTALGGAQLNASSGVSGAYAYTPAAGAVLNTGTNALSVVLTPSDTTDYVGASASATLVVTPASLTVTANNASRPYGSNNPVFSGVIAGLQNGDNITANYNSTATPSSAIGTYPISPSLVDPGNRQTNYTVNLVNGTLTVLAAPGVFQSITVLPGGGAQLSLSGSSGAQYTLDVSTDLVNWTPLTNFIMTNGAVVLTDFTATNVPAQYYLLVSP
jgi:sugar lactone lactonase YvrE